MQVRFVKFDMPRPKRNNKMKEIRAPSWSLLAYLNLPSVPEEGHDT